jgi:hypothetical protein
MSLNWDLTKIKDSKSVCWTGEDNKSLNAVTEVLIWGTMFVGIREITAHNVDVFAERLRVWWDADDDGGPLREWKDGHADPVSRHVTPEEVRAHVGLKTNATNYTERQWLKVLTERRTRIANDRLRAAQRAAARA